MNFKKMAVVTLSAVSAFSMTVCSSPNLLSGNMVEADAAQVVQVNSTLENAVGGWELNQGSLSLSKHKEAKAAFEKAVEGLTGYQYQAAAYLGRQIAAGTNYAYLCRGTVVVPNAESEYVILYVYQDLQGNAKITGTKALFDNPEGTVPGGWFYNQGEVSLQKHRYAARAYQKAMKGISGASYKPIAYLGYQVVGGKNYAVFCRRTQTSGAKTDFAVVYIYKDLKGRAKILKIEDVEIAAGLDDTANAAYDGNTSSSNPFVQAGSLEEAAQIAGFDLAVPDAPLEYPDRIIQAVEHTMIEVIFVNAKNETAQGLDEAYRIRKASASGDISGDYCEYPDVWTEIIGDKAVTMKGSSGKCSTAIWEFGGYSYAVDAQKHPLAKEAMMHLIEAVK